MDKLRAMLGLFTAGKEMANATAWTNASIVGNFILALLGAATVLGGPQFNLTPDQVQAVAGIIVAAAGAYNAFVHVATDPRVGLRTVSGTDSGAGGNANAAPGVNDINGG